MEERRFHIEQLDQNKFIKSNDLKEVTNPVMFNSGNGNTPDGLLSDEIFGITREERSGIYAYVDLGEYFIQPYYYKIWLDLDRKLKSCIYETESFIINSEGYLEISESGGETGIDFLRKNIDKINFKKTKKKEILTALMKGKDNLFTNKFVIIPPYYRDVDTKGSGRIGVGEVNKLYVALMNNVKALKTSDDYGLELAGGIRGKIQDTMLEIYNWFTAGESIIGGEHTGAGIFKKFGIMHRTVMAKSADNAARLVISAPNIDYDSIDDYMVDMDHSAIPLAAAAVISYPFMIYYMRQWFNNEIGGEIYYDYIDKDGKLKRVELDDPLIAFSDDRFDKELNEFIHGYSNRFKPVELPNKENKKIRLRFKGYKITPDEYAKGVRENDTVVERDLTWLDIIFRAACEATKDKNVMITRYPIDSHFSHFYTLIRIYSTIETEPMVIGGQLYRWYPKFRQEDIGTNTSNKFIDTLSMCNLDCPAMLADYDGDQVTIKMAYSVEANQELEQYKNSNIHYMSLSGMNIRSAEKEARQAIYNLTLVLPETKLVDPEF